MTNSKSWNNSTKLNDIVSVTDFGAYGDGGHDDTAAVTQSINNLPQRGKLTFPQAASPSSGYKLTAPIVIQGKGGSVIDFNNQILNFQGLTGTQTALTFNGCAEMTANNLFMTVNSACNIGLLFDADASNITIHSVFNKFHVSGGVTAIQVGPNSTYQFSDSTINDLYGSDATVGVQFNGQNTLAMNYGCVAAYNNTARGFHFLAGNGVVASLDVAASGDDIYFGSLTGVNHNLLQRWQINGGYSEEGVSGERFINSYACTDTNPFTSEIVINGFRCTPFSTTNVQNFIQWNLNGDLILNNMQVDHGQQQPVIATASNTTYTPARVFFTGVVSCNPTTAPQQPMTYTVSSPKEQVEINARYINAIDWWQNAGAINSGTIPYGIYTSKLFDFNKVLLSLPNLVGAWMLKDLPSTSCVNSVLGGSGLTLSSFQIGDMVLNDGLIGLFQQGTNTTKTLSTTSATFSAQPAYTFGYIGRAPNNLDTVDNHNIGGPSAIRLGFGGGATVQLRVGAVEAYVTIDNAYDPCLIIGRYTSATSVVCDAINLRTGAVFTNTNTTSIPAYTSLTWTNGINTSSVSCVFGMPFVFQRALSNSEVSTLQQAATLLTSTWRVY